jgi:hypothetical protein
MINRRSPTQSKIVLFAGMMAAAAGGVAQPAVAAQPTPFLEDSTIVGAGGTLTATRVPVETSTGSVVYQDVTIQLNATTKGGLTLGPGYPKVQPSPPLVTSGFLTGNYAGPATVANGKYLVTVTGPGVGADGTTVWSLTASKGANSCTAPLPATWYTGPIAENPLAPDSNSTRSTRPTTVTELSALLSQAAARPVTQAITTPSCKAH